MERDDCSLMKTGVDKKMRRRRRRIEKSGDGKVGLLRNYRAEERNGDTGRGKR